MEKWEANKFEQSKIIHCRFSDCKIPQELIILDKAVETFLLWNAKEIGIDVKDYGFANNPKQFGFSLKQVNIDNNQEYKRLLHDLSNAPGFVMLREIFNQFVT